MRRALAAGVLLAALAFPVVAKAQEPFAWNEEQHGWSRVVEQQSASPFCTTDLSTPCVVNPTGICAWDIDDHFRYGSAPAVLAEGTTSGSFCLNADQSAHWLGAKLQARTPDLAVSVAYSPGITVELIPRQIGNHLWEYRGCVLGPQYSGPEVGQTIPGSNGGWAVPTTITLSVTNATGRPVRDVWGQAETYIGADGYCQPLIDWFLAEGALWRTGL